MASVYVVRSIEKEAIIRVLTRIFKTHRHEMDCPLGDITHLDQLLVAALVRLDHVTFCHSVRTQKLALIIGKKVGLSSSELLSVSLGALLHDIGKGQIPLHILEKKEPLTSEEWKLIQSHPVRGYHYLKQSDLSDVVKKIVLNHHVWMNGEAGYPLGSNQQIPCPLTQIVTIADVIDAMTSPRPYRSALSLLQCMDYLAGRAGSQFNPVLVEVFRELISDD